MRTVLLLMTDQILLSNTLHFITNTENFTTLMYR